MSNSAITRICDVMWTEYIRSRAIARIANRIGFQ